jgi:hypothetical protein
MPATLEQLAELPEAIRQHYQFPDDFCAVSGFECVAKLEGHLAPNAFPLQSDPANLHKGFEPAHCTYLTGLGFTVHDVHHPTGQAAAAVIQTETDAGRFPLVSMPVPDEQGHWGYHVFLFARHENAVIFIDPSVPRVMLRGIDQIPVALENMRNRHPLEHHTVHLLTYKPAE